MAENNRLEATENFDSDSDELNTFASSLADDQESIVQPECVGRYRIERIEPILPSASNKETISRHDDESIATLAASTYPQDLSKQSDNLTSFGRYQIIRTLGSGGMGTVYLAHDTELDRSVALKIPKFQPTDGPQFQERFRREARLAAKLDDPAIG